MRYAIALLLLSALLWIVLAEPHATLRSAPSAAVAANLTASAPIVPQGRAFAVLHGPDLLSALSQFEAQASPRERIRIRVEVDAACRVPELLKLDGRSEPDPRRDPALQELLRRCARLPVPSMYVPANETQLPFEQIEDADTRSSALMQLRQAQTSDELAAAWLNAYERGALPQEQIFADGRRLLSEEAQALIYVVIDWRECVRLNACGSDSLITLRVCALHGCTAGSDLRSAWHQALAPRDFDAALAIYDWLLRWQRSG